MVFSSFATVLSANSARVSALKQSDKKNNEYIYRADAATLFSFTRQSTYLLESVIQDFDLLFILVLFLRIL